MPVGLVFQLLLFMTLLSSFGRTVNSFSSSHQYNAATPSTARSSEISSTTEESIHESLVVESSNDLESTSEQSDFQCSYCGQSFGTRNALFRHLRNDMVCSPKHDSAAYNGSDGRFFTMVKESIALRFGYMDNVGYTADEEEAISKNDHAATTMAEDVGNVLQYALLDSLRETVREWYGLANDSDVLDTMEILGSTQASLAKLRRVTLKQEAGCAASGDVLFLNFMTPKALRKESKEKQDIFWTKVGTTTREKLQHQIPQAELFDLQIVGAKKGPKQLHAEMSATQYIYHYLLPLSWLPEEDALRAWWHSSPAEGTHQSHQRRKLKSKPPESLKRLKEALRSAECEKVSAEQMKADTEHTLRLATGRFGALGARTKRAWHNFADPVLKGNASPNNEPVWRALDKARVVDFVETANQEMVVVLEFRGDGFVQEQIRRIVGSAVAMTHSWLPFDFIELATDSDIAIETPLAPPNRLVLSGVRYHFDELQSCGRPFFEPHKSRRIFQLSQSESEDGIGWAVEKMLQDQNNEDSKLAMQRESSWLEDLQKNIAPQIQRELAMQEATVSMSPDTSSKLVTYSQLYDPALSELRRIKSNDLWPETSTARSTVIKKETVSHTEKNEESNENSPPRRNGSFTIVNPNVEQNWDSLPLGNKLFPELVETVFDLEMQLAESENATSKITDVNEITSPASMKERQPSSHCAVNCNAQFTPHVDSGRGAGQKLSMIVGMGDYVGGELRVEGDTFDIQYKPVVFDGWKLRHWTNPFAGERFSLVYFTPEAKE